MGRAVVGCGVDATLLKLSHLRLDHVAAVLVVLVRRALGVEVLRVDRLLVDQPVLLCREILHPVAPLRVGAELTQRLNVDRARDPRRGPAVRVIPDDAALVVGAMRECPPNASIGVSSSAVRKYVPTLGAIT